MKEFLNTLVVLVDGNRTPDCTLASIDLILSTDFKSGCFVVCRLVLFGMLVVAVSSIVSLGC